MCHAPQLIAVYGSLMRAEGMLETLGVAPFLRFLGAARLPGELFDLGDYPGLRWDGASSRFPVHGELFAILDPRALVILDEYEGCASTAANLPDGSVTPAPFARRQVALLEPNVEAWVYLYHGTVEGRPRVVGTSWPDYRAGRRYGS